MNNNAINLKTANDVGLPLDPETFSKVILDFLGRKENLSYKNHDNFIINLEDISQFNHIINSKISYQKNITLDHLSITLGYLDGTFRTINGSKALDNFLETRSIETTSVNLNWKIIIKFDSSPTIETQEVNLLFITNIEIDSKNSKEEFSYIELSINHTNQSWALDILNAFKEKINEVRIEPTTLKKKYNQFRDNPSYITAALMVFMLLMIGLILPLSPEISQNLKQDLVRHTLNQDYENETSKLISLLHVTALNKEELKKLKVNDREIEEIIDNNNKETFNLIFLFILLMTTPFILKKYITYSINYLDNKSFITINKVGYTQLQNYKDKKSKITFISFTLIISSIIVSIIASVVFKIFEKIIF